VGFKITNLYIIFIIPFVFIVYTHLSSILDRYPRFFHLSEQVSGIKNCNSELPCKQQKQISVLHFFTKHKLQTLGVFITYLLYSYKSGVSNLLTYAILSMYFTVDTTIFITYVLAQTLQYNAI